VSFAVGSLVKARGREWVVLPESTPDTVVARPLGGGDDEVAGFFLPVEPVEPATFQLPDPAEAGDYRSCRLLRDALRLGFRSSAGPFRSFARLGVEPRPYQLVPLLLALKLDPVRLLIADDVGIGKTVEAGLIVRELIDRGEVKRFAVLCPPQLAEQWQGELNNKFHLDAELVLPGTVSRLEKACRMNQSVFDRFPHVIVSTDFIKADRRRDDFVRDCPELVIVDEAHTCARAGDGRGARHQRHQLVRQLAGNKDRHLLLVTATPHSGNEEAFRSLLSLLDTTFADLPADLSGDRNRQARERIAAHFVQRRRGDIRHYLQTDTPFPEREEKEETYKLHPEYLKLFKQVLEYAKESVSDTTLNRQRQRIRWWSALALLRSMASSPAAAMATLRTRAVEANTPEEADAQGRQSVLDLVEDDSAEGSDVAPAGADEEPGEQSEAARRLMAMANAAEALHGAKDTKLKRAIVILEDLLANGYHPILFCRFIPTAEYVAAELRKKLKGVTVEAVTGTLPPKEREDRVNALKTCEKRILVCTDCLSEGINLQHLFNAVVHYDLSWNPTRHEQREGRVDRYGQPSPKVRTVTYYGIDNQIDGVVLDVLLRKHKAIRTSLGVSVPLPTDSEQVIQAVFEGMLLKGKKKKDTGPGLFDDLLDAEVDQQWKSATEREKQSRTLFAQQTIKVEDVVREMDAARAAAGTGVDVTGFVTTALAASNAAVDGSDPVRVDLTETPRALKDQLYPALGLKPGKDVFAARFELPVAGNQILLSRSSPAVEALANHVLNAALDPHLDGPARRCGVIRTSKVAKRTTLLLLRHRFHIVTKIGDDERPLLAEDSQLVAFAGSPQNAEWLPPEVAERLLLAEPEANVTAEQARDFIQKVIDGIGHLRPKSWGNASRRPQSGPPSEPGEGCAAPRRSPGVARRAGRVRLPAEGVTAHEDRHLHLRPRRRLHPTHRPPPTGGRRGSTP
jgi:superfamily II DNA or RNA helicase